MKKRSFIIPFLVVMLIPLSISAKQKDERMHLLDMFDHDMHFGIFEGTVECTECHRTDDSYSREGVDKRGCHLCHNNPKAVIPANNDCGLCHGSFVKPIKPTSHTSAWKTQIHPVVAKQDGKRCGTCHSINFCVDCHQQRDSVRQTMHKRNFRFFHSIEARANPAKCDKCHTTNFCMDCHNRRRIP